MMREIAVICKDNAAFAGLIGVILGGLLSLLGTLLQSYLNTKKEKEEYERTFRDKIREEKKKIYSNCLTELKDIKNKYYYCELTDDSKIGEITIQDMSLLELQASSNVMKKLKALASLKMEDTEVEIFEKQYDELLNEMRKDVTINYS